MAFRYLEHVGPCVIAVVLLMQGCWSGHLRRAMRACDRFRKSVSGWLLLALCDASGLLAGLRITGSAALTVFVGLLP